MNEDLQYWKKRCELAEIAIDLEGIDKIQANFTWKEFKKIPVPITTQLYISAEYLQGLHPELSIEGAESLNQYARGKTITHRECYGDGSIMYPLWKANH